MQKHHEQASMQERAHYHGTKPARFMPKTFPLKIALHKPNDRPTSLATSLILDFTPLIYDYKYVSYGQ